MTYVYGPVSSWRYGRSLGIDITTPPKKCTYNCIYCQLGATKRHVTSPEEIQEDMPSLDDIISEVRKTLDNLDQQTIDVLAFSGTGEPTLNLELGSITTAIRKVAPHLPIVLLTNGSLLPRDDVRTGVMGVDIVTAKLDAGDDTTFKRINHPAKDAFHLDDIIAAIKSLSKSNCCMVALEVMLLQGPRGLTNVEGPSRSALIDRILEIDPDIVQIYTPWRPTAVSSIIAVSRKILETFAEDLEKHLGADKLWVYGVHDARGKAVVWKTHQDLEEEILTLLHRRPCRISDVALSLGIMPVAAANVLEKLRSKGQVILQPAGAHVFYDIE
ncbi:MAG: radical SAM protein [Candidatus Thorarchaeota archaeon]